MKARPQHALRAVGGQVTRVAQSWQCRKRGGWFTSDEPSQVCPMCA